MIVGDLKFGLWSIGERRCGVHAFATVNDLLLMW